MHAINSARRPFGAGTRGELNVILLLSLERTIGNFFENLRMIHSAREFDAANGKMV